MKLFEKHVIVPYPIEKVFALTVDLEIAPHWHSFFTHVLQLTPQTYWRGVALADQLWRWPIHTRNH